MHGTQIANNSSRTRARTKQLSLFDPHKILTVECYLLGEEYDIAVKRHRGQGKAWLALNEKQTERLKYEVKAAQPKPHSKGRAAA